MSNPEIKILRDELAKIIVGNQKRDLLIEELMHALGAEKQAMGEVIMENDSLKRRLKIYKGHHALPSHGSVPAQQKKARSAKGIKPSGGVPKAVVVAHVFHECICSDCTAALMHC